VHRGLLLSSSLPSLRAQGTFSVPQTANNLEGRPTILRLPAVVLARPILIRAGLVAGERVSLIPAFLLLFGATVFRHCSFRDAHTAQSVPF
jgi:hypothetical protein